jgi:hypothetical protein
MDLTYKRAVLTGDILMDWLKGWYNNKILQKLVIRVAMQWHRETRRRVDVFHHGDMFIVVDSISRDDINKSLPSKMGIYDVYKHRIWSSDSLRDNICPVCRNKYKLKS